MLNRRRRLHHSSRVKCPLLNKSASWVFGVNIFDLDLGVQVDSVKQPILRDSVGSRYDFGAEIIFLNDSNFWCVQSSITHNVAVHVPVLWPVFTHTHPFRMLLCP